MSWYRSLALTPTIVALRSKFEEIRRRELEKTLSRLPHLSDREKNALEALTSGIVNKILHHPLASLKKAEEDGLADSYLDALQGLFQLTVPTPGSPQNSAEDPQEKRKKV